MFLEQGEVIDEIMTKIRNGRITRRTFLECGHSGRFDEHCSRFAAGSLRWHEQ